MKAMPRDGGRGYRPHLSRAVIVDAALDLVRTEGLTALSMRRVADRLQTAPMSLYRHIADREGLLLGMLDVIAASIELPPGHDDPRAEVRALTRTMRATFTRDPWVVIVLATDGLASPLILPLVDRFFDAFYRAGLAGRDAVQAWTLVFQYLYGEAITHQRDTTTTFAARMVRDANTADYPALGRMLSENAPFQQRADEDFAANLERLLDAILPA